MQNSDRLKKQEEFKEIDFVEFEFNWSIFLFIPELELDLT